MFYQIGRMVMRVLTHILYHVEVRGREKLPLDRGYIVCSNHRANYDPVFLGIHTKPQLNFMAKEELFRNPLVRIVIRGLGAFPVKRGKGDTSAIDHAEQLIRDGKVLAMFPEGTRSKDGKPLRPKSGAAVVASQTGADVIPAAIYFQGKLHFRSKVIVSFGDVIPNEQLHITGKSPREIKEASNLIMGKIIALLEECEREEQHD